MAKGKWPKMGGRKSASDTTGFFKPSLNSYMSNKYAEELASSLGVDVKDKKALATVKENIEKIVDNLTDTSSEYQDMLKTLTNELNKYQSKGAKFQPKHMKELLDLQGDLAQVSQTIRALGQGNKVSESSLAALSPLMLRVAQSVTDLKSGAYGNIALKQIFEEKGLGEKTDVGGIDKIYKANTDLLRRDYKDWMRNHSKLLEIGAHRGLTKAALATFLGPASPLAEVLNDTLQLDKRLAKKTENFWRWARGQSEKDIDNAIKQTQIQEQTAKAASVQAEATQDFKDETTRRADIEATSAAAFMQQSKDEKKRNEKREKEQTKLLKSIDDGISEMRAWNLVGTIGNLAKFALPLAIGALIGDQLYKQLKKFFPELGKNINEGVTALDQAFGGNTKAVPVPFDWAAPKSRIGADWSDDKIVSEYEKGGLNLGEIISHYAKKYGVDAGTMAAILGKESTFGLDKRSQIFGDKTPGRAGLGAQGIAQFMERTWKGLARKDPSLGNFTQSMVVPKAVKAQAMLLSETSKMFAKTKKGEKLTAGESYLSYFFSPEDLRSFMVGFNANPDAPAQVKQSTRDSNPELFYKDPKTKRMPRSAREFYDLIQGSLGSSQAALAESYNIGVTKSGTNFVQSPAFSSTRKPGTPGASVQRATPIAPTTAIPMAAPSSEQPVPQAQHTTDVTIDKIPMFVDDAGLVLLTTGGLM